MIRVRSVFLWCLIVSAWIFTGAQNVTENEIRPYEFTFNIVDFQHRSEKKDDDGLITGEYGFITADGIYHETAYATDKTGDFIITKMRHRKITSLKDAQEIFKDKPEQAKMLTEALMKSCEGCEIELDRQETSSFVKTETSTNIPKKTGVRIEKKLDLAMKEMMKVLNKKTEDSQTAEDNAEGSEYRKEKKLSGSTSRSENGTTTSEIIRDMVDAAKKILGNDASDDGGPENERKELTSDEELEKMANDLFYRFNYTITSHGHWEDGFRDGRKDGEYNAKFKDGIDTHVKYTSNEFGHQPNITLVPRVEEIIDYNNNNSSSSSNADKGNSSANATTTNAPSTSTEVYRGHYFNWFRK